MAGDDWNDSAVGVLGHAAHESTIETEPHAMTVMMANLLWSTYYLALGSPRLERLIWNIVTTYQLMKAPVSWANGSLGKVRMHP
jgi:hypothetical protein